MDVNELINKLPSEPIFSTEGYDEWVEPSERPRPPDADTYEFLLTELSDVTTGRNQYGPHATFKMDFEVAKGKFQGRAVRFQRISTAQFQRSGKTTSFMNDLLHAARIPSPPGTNAELVQLLNQMIQKRRLIGGRLDWSGRCGNCYKNVVMKLTGAASYEAASPTDQQRKDANRASTKFKSYRAFPNLADGSKQHDPPCPTCNGTIFAEPEITFVLVESNGAAPAGGGGTEAPKPTDASAWLDS